MSRNTVGIEINKILGGPRGWPRLMDLRIIWTVVGDIVHEVQARMDTVRDAACKAHEAYTQLKSMDVEPLDEVVTRLKQQETIDDWINALTAIIEIEHRENLTNVAPGAKHAQTGIRGKRGGSFKWIPVARPVTHGFGTSATAGGHSPAMCG